MPVTTSFRGRFIVLEGIDGAGTTTQLHRLAAWLRDARGQAVLDTFEPTDLPIGRYIRTILRGDSDPPHPDVVALLFAADRVDHVTSQIEPALARGAHVLCDRYIGSSFAYQGTGSEPGWVRTINSRARAPDLTLYLRVDLDAALGRIGRRDGERRELFERRELLARIGAAYDRLYGVTGGTAELSGRVVDANASADVVFEACQAAVAALLETDPAVATS